jgi:maltose-binding protein MalE
MAMSMDVRNIYYLYGFINADGTFVKNYNYKTYIAECKTGNNNGYSFYSFLTIKKINDRESYNTNIIKLENLIELIEDPTVMIEKETENIEQLKQYFKRVYYSQEDFYKLEESNKKKNL